MSDNPRVSVIMGVHNDEQFIAESIESVLNQTYTDFEFIVVEDAPTDRTPDILNEYDDNRLIRIRNDTNLGLTISLNRALDHVRGEYVARQDADDISRSDRFVQQVSHLDEHPAVGCVGSSATLIDETGSIIGHRRALTKPTSDEFFKKNQVIHGSSMMRRSILANLGGYHEYFSVAQDYELWLRMIDKWAIHNLEEPLYKLRVHKRSIYYTRQRKSLAFSQLAKRSTASSKYQSFKSLKSGFDPDPLSELNATEHLEVQRSFAKTLLRYGQPNEARKVLSEQRYEGGLDLSSWLLYGLTYLPKQAINFLVGSYRQYLNVRTWARNRIHS
jgi:glycosyltransferase involved in cell wall biosynthesis